MMDQNTANFAGNRYLLSPVKATNIKKLRIDWFISVVNASCKESSPQTKFILQKKPNLKLEMSHELSDSSHVTLATKDQHACKFHQYGYCKFGLTCRKFHTPHTCQQPQCSDKTCLHRHPRKCKYFTNFGSCKFGDDCSFSHKSETSNGFSKKTIDMLKSELQSVKDSLKEKEIEIADLVSRVSTLESTSRNSSNPEIKKLVANGPTRFDVKENEIPDKCVECDKEIFSSTDYKFHMKWVHEQPSLIFKCNHCDFESTSIAIMGKHLRKRHGENKSSRKDFTSSRDIMCQSCLQTFSEVPAEFEWPSWTGIEGPFMCQHCASMNIEWWTNSCQKDLPTDVIKLSNLHKVAVSGFYKQHL